VPTESPTPGGLLSTRWLVAAPVIIAMLSLGASIFQSWNYARNIESAQRNILRAESLKTCRDIIDAFFQFRLKADEANQMQAGSSAMASAELKGVVYRFSAYSTFLANFQGEAARKGYTELSWEMLAIAENAAKISKEDFDKRFAKVDEQFGRLNEDCVKAAQIRLL
jgi:5'-deoxynucleotidase YfbR-like HD superfamily hydrolase